LTSCSVHASREYPAEGKERFVIDGIWPAWSGTRLICGGCGRTAPNIDQATAIAAIEELTGGLLEVTA
jgi:hypothetical protein